VPRQVEGEHASSPKQVARVDPAIVRFSAPSAEGELVLTSMSTRSALGQP
jgi:hypothetical protein